MNKIILCPYCGQPDKELSELDKRLARISKNLSSKAFLSKAPAEVVRKTRDEFDDLKKDYV